MNKQIVLAAANARVRCPLQTSDGTCFLAINVSNGTFDAFTEVDTAVEERLSAALPERISLFNRSCP